MAEEPAAGWAAIVLAEAAVCYAYSAAGPLLSGPERASAAALYEAHEQARDEALLMLTGTGAGPVDLPTFFALPEQLESPEQARALLAAVESRLARSYADLIAVLPLPQRQDGLTGVLLATRRALGWGAGAGPWGATEPVPTGAQAS